DRFTRCVPYLAKPIIVRQPNGAIWSLMEKSVMSRRHQNEGRGSGTGIVSKGLEPGLPQRQREKTAGQRPDPNRSLTINEDGCRKTTWITLFQPNRLTYRPSQMEEATRPLHPQRAISVFGQPFQLQRRSAAPVLKYGQSLIFPEEKPGSPRFQPH